MPVFPEVDSHRRIVRIINKTETFDILGENVAPVTGLCARPHVWSNPNLLTDNRLGDAVSLNYQREFIQLHAP